MRSAINRLGYAAATYLSLLIIVEIFYSDLTFISYFTRIEFVLLFIVVVDFCILIIQTCVYLIKNPILITKVQKLQIITTLFVSVFMIMVLLRSIDIDIKSFIDKGEWFIILLMFYMLNWNFSILLMQFNKR